MRIPRLRVPRDDRPRRRGLNPLWGFFWLILIIVLLGLIFGGYRKGTPVNGPGTWTTTGLSAPSATQGATQ